MLSRTSVRCLTLAAVHARPLGVMGLRWCCGSSSIPTPNKDSRDILDRVAADHRKIEDVFRAMRSRNSDRASLLRTLASNLVAHNEAEEVHFYPHVRGLNEGSIKGTAEVSHEKVEHIQGLLALLNLMEEPDIHSESWETKLSALVTGTMHHVNEEELKVHNLARSQLSPEKRAAMGDQFVQARDQLIAGGIGDLDNVRKMVQERASLLQKVKAKVMG